MNRRKRAAPARPALGRWVPSRPRGGDYLKTLHEWGNLPEIVSVPNVVRLLAFLTGQNAAALNRVLVDAILAGEVEIWGLGSDGAAGDAEDWRKNYVRVLQRAYVTGKSPPDEEGNVTYTLAMQDSEPKALHLDATGIRPCDAVALLVTRGRKVPSELLELMPELQPARTGGRESAAGTRHLSLVERGPSATAPPSGVRRRRDLLAPLVDAARRASVDPDDAPAVFVILKSWASEKPPRPPLVGITEDGRLQWRDGSDRAKELTTDALRERIRNLKKRAG